MDEVMPEPARRARLYDRSHRRLVFIHESASAEFWDDLWSKTDLLKLVRTDKSRAEVKTTCAYLPPGARVLEGGCGLAQRVYALRAAGFDAIGVDFAEQTVRRVNETFPELPVTVDDVRKLAFPDGFFDGYWSLGVIEHFAEGYEAVAEEMVRVLRPGGYLFLAFPAMSPLRRLKAALGVYKVTSGDVVLPGFYQFALDPRDVVGFFAARGFVLVERRFFDAIDGIADELGPLGAGARWLADREGPLWSMLRMGSELLLGSCLGHCALLVLRKRPGPTAL